jgi:hypothetical protein
MVSTLFLKSLYFLARYFCLSFDYFVDMGFRGKYFYPTFEISALLVPACPAQSGKLLLWFSGFNFCTAILLILKTEQCY